MTQPIRILKIDHTLHKSTLEIYLRVRDQILVEFHEWILKNIRVTIFNTCIK